MHKWAPCSPSLAIAGFVKEVFWVRVPLLAPTDYSIPRFLIFTFVTLRHNMSQACVINP